MALTNKELQDILDNLTPEEQKQLYHQLSRNISNTEPTTPLQSNKHPVSKENSKVYCCIKCGSVNYKKNGYTSTGMQRYRCKDCNSSWSENYGDSLRYTHLSEDTWKEMLRGFVEELSISKIAKNCDLSTKTVWLAKTKVNQAIMTMYGYTELFRGNTQADEYYTRTAFKGKRDPEFFIYILRRMPRLVANLLFLPESVYERPGDTRPVMGLSVWTQYVLDNFATVDEAVAELSKEKFRIDAPDLPNGVQSRLHLAISDPSGDSAIFEYRDGKLEIHHGRQCQVMTNSPFYDDQLAILGYWRQIGGLTMLPGTNRASDRFVRASFYIDAVVQTSDPKIAVPAVMSVMRNVSVPYGISTPDKPHIASTRWRTVCDQKNRIYYFEPTLAMETFWVDLSKIDFGQGTPERVLKLVGGRTFTGDATAEFRRSDKPFVFLFGV